MGRMVRKQIVMDPELEKALELRSRETGVSQSQLVSRALERYLADEAERQKRMEAWARVEALMRGEGLDEPVGGQLPWTREELHERGR